jgi:beta-xylosidase
MAWHYRNPVWPEYFADPFVLRWADSYYAYGTGERLTARDGKPAAFAILRSSDLVAWEPLGGALFVDGGDIDHAFWAPEVAACDGKFFLYYSTAPAGRDELHRLRVAVAERPEGPFTDRGAVLPGHDEFCIDAHPFRDLREGFF